MSKRRRLAKSMMSIKEWLVDGEVFRVVQVSAEELGSACADVNWDKMEIRIIKGQPKTTQCKRIAHELGHARGFGESHCAAIESIIGMLIQHGVIFP